jgi:hypothetical protein
MDVTVTVSVLVTKEDVVMASTSIGPWRTKSIVTAIKAKRIEIL